MFYLDGVILDVEVAGGAAQIGRVHVPRPLVKPDHESLVQLTASCDDKLTPLLLQLWVLLNGNEYILVTELGTLLTMIYCIDLLIGLNMIWAKVMVLLILHSGVIVKWLRRMKKESSIRDPSFFDWFFFSSLLKQLSLYSTRTQNIWRQVLLRHLTQKIGVLRHLTQEIPTCWYLLR